MKSLVVSVLLSLIVSSFSSKNLFDRKEHKGKHYGDIDGVDGVRYSEKQLAKEAYYRNKHFEHFGREELARLLKHFPRALTDDDIRLQADIGHERRRKNEGQSNDGLHLQHLQPISAHRYRNDGLESRSADKHEKHDKHDKHEKHHKIESSARDKKNVDLESQRSVKSKDYERVYHYKHPNAHQKNHIKDKHYKKGKKAMAKKHRIAFPVYY